MKKLLLSFLAISMSALVAQAFSIEALRFHCADDTTKINQILHEAVSNTSLKSAGSYMSFFADKLLGTPYVAHTLEGDREYLSINVDQLDCTTFVETLAALTKAAKAKSPRLHYISAWIIENSNRGNFTEITSSLPHSEYLTKTINYMSTHRDNYPALADSATFEGIRNLEAGYNRHMYPYINKRNLYKKDFFADLRDGDIVCLTTKIDGLDVSHLGIVRFVKGKPHLLHASSTAKKVIVDKDDLFEMLKLSRNVTGIRVVRLTDDSL